MDSSFLARARAMEGPTAVEGKASMEVEDSTITYVFSLVPLLGSDTTQEYCLT